MTVSKFPFIHKLKLPFNGLKVFHDFQAIGGDAVQDLGAEKIPAQNVGDPSWGRLPSGKGYLNCEGNSPVKATLMNYGFEVGHTFMIAFQPLSIIAGTNNWFYGSRTSSASFFALRNNTPDDFGDYSFRIADSEFVFDSLIGLRQTFDPIIVFLHVSTDLKFTAYANNLKLFEDQAITGNLPDVGETVALGARNNLGTLDAASNIRVFAAAAWDRPLSEAEIFAISNRFARPIGIDTAL